ncbi:MAG: homoserine dehydrogenase [Clostridiales bacterium]|nr:homoserine dehydrogenase [Clostridiales bacterium]
MNIAVMGYGVVGSGVAEVLERNGAGISARAGEEIRLTRILDLRDFPGDPNESKLTKEFNDILRDDSVKIVVETMGGVNPAYDFTMKLLQAGKSVVTSNKELVAQKGLELLQCADAHGVNYLFEASVGGGIPIIRPMAQCLAANEIEGIAGILNGTTNFILTKMIRDNMSFDQALQLAQDNGYAEKDPTDDIEGHDACRKVCILASLAFGRHVYPNQVGTQGITNISLIDVEYARQMGGVIKLLGQIKVMDGDQIAAFVSPAIVLQGSQLANVDDVFNAIMVRGDAVGDVVFYGRGAGKLPTASAVVADVVDCVKHVERKKLFGWGPGGENYVVDHKAVLKSRFYVRAAAKKAEILARIPEAQIIGLAGRPEDETAFLASKLTENELDAKLYDLKVYNKIRVTKY